MITPPEMLTKEKQAAWGLCFAGVISLAVLAGCSPAGSDALLNGKRLLDRGQPLMAVRKFRDATVSMPTNALAWGYLGVAYHQAGSVSNAMEAYSRSLALRPDLPEIRFSLGCLWSEQGEWGRARDQLAAATVPQPRNAAAWHRLGEAQLRLGQSGDAARTLQESLRLDARNPDAWNWLGVAQLQQGRTTEAVSSFQAALRLRTNHGPALLNLAIIHQTKLSQPQKAIELYRQYLAFLPNASNAQQVRQVLARLQDQGRPVPQTVSLAEKAKPAPDRSADAELGPGSDARTGPSGLLPRSVAGTNPVPRFEPIVSSPVPSDRVMAERKPGVEPVPESVRVEPAPTIASTAQSPSSPTPARTVVVVTAPSEETSVEAPSGGRSSAPGNKGFFAKINPMNLFRKRSEQKRTTPLPPRSALLDQKEAAPPASLAVEPPKSRPTHKPVQVEVVDAGRFLRYRYQYGAAPPAGDAQAASRAFEQGDQLRKRGRKPEAIRAYRAAVEADPSDFAAHFNLGLISLETGDLATALRSYEAATRIDPNSAAARYNFALALKSGGYPLDSANELLTLLEQDPDDARGHLTLGNLYAQQFGDKGKAREHYLRVLELEPGHPQAGSIHFWLVQNPP